MRSNVKTVPLFTCPQYRLVFIRETPAETYPKLTHPHEVADILRTHIGDDMELQEHFVVMAINTANRLLDVRTVTKGLLDQSLAHPREVYRFAIAANAKAIFVGHNHPSGNLVMSAEDITITRQISEAGKVIGIPCLDSIVVGTTGYVSACEHGIL